MNFTHTPHQVNTIMTALQNLVSSVQETMASVQEQAAPAQPPAPTPAVEATAEAPKV